MDSHQPTVSDSFQTPEEAFQYLRHLGHMKDGDIDLAEAGLALGLIFMPGLHPDRYRQHLHKMSRQVAEEYQTALAGQEETLALRVQTLRKVIHEINGYQGDTESYDDIQNANLIRVIERRRGLPIALGIIYIHLARKQGWTCDGLNFPGHFLIRPERGGERLILDPFKEGQEMTAASMRQLLKSIAGKNAELSHNFYDTVSNREVLVRLENNLKKRLIEGEDYQLAITVAEAIEAFSPEEYRTYLDKGVLYAKLGQSQAAIEALEAYIQKTPNTKERHDARILLQQIKAGVT